jgi:acetolactate synthase-1/3 small subunit
MISILVRNHPGVLSHVSGMFTRRGYNIESIAAGVTENPDITRITIVATGDEIVLEQVSKQLRKLIDVIKVQDLKYSESIVRELVLLTIYVPKERRQDVVTMANTFQATVVDITEKTMTFEFVGNERKVNLVIQAMSEYKVKEMARTGFVALPMESQSEREHTLI